MNSFQEQFRRARNCSIPLITARSADAVATVETIARSLNGKLDQTPLIQWDVMRGLTGWNDCGRNAVAQLLNGQSAAIVSSKPVDALELLATVPEDAICLAHNLHLFWNDEKVLQGILNLRDTYKAIGAVLVGLTLTGSVLPAELTEHTLVIDEPLPTGEELGELARDVFKSAGLPAPDAEVIAQATDATMGLSGFAAEQSISLNMSKSGLNIAGTWDRKRKTIESDGLLKVYQGKESFTSLGGNEGFKQFNTALFRGNDSPKAAILMDEIEKAVAQDSGNSTKTELIGLLLSWFQDRDVDGELLNGVPGAGKTAGVKCIGNEFNVPVILFNLASMQNQYVGNSQKRLITALDRIDAMCSGRPIVYATCNRLEALSPELRSRFKLGTFFFDLPNELERSAIWKIYISAYKLPIDSPIPESAGWTGREIRECCHKAYRLNIPLTESAKYVVPVARSSAETIKALRVQASGKFLSAAEPGVYRFEETAIAASGRKFRE